MGVFDGPGPDGFPGALIPQQPSGGVPGGLGAYGFPEAPLPQQSDGGVLGFLGTLGVTPYASAPPAATADNFGWQGLLPGTFGVSPYASAPPAATADTFGWQGLLPGTFGAAPYASALPAATAENFGWQGLPGTFESTPAASTAPAMPTANGLLAGPFAPASVATGGVSASVDSATGEPGSSLAVIYGGSRGDSGNPLGHIAIAVEGHGVYSFGTDTSFGSSATDYVNDQKSQRDMAIVTIPTTAEQNKAVLDYLQQYNDPQGIDYFDNCANRTGTALMRAGIFPYPEILAFPPLPANVLLQALSADGANATYFAKNGSPSDLGRFNPQP